MELKSTTLKVSNLISKYRFVIIVILIGFLLVVFPGRKRTELQQPASEIPQVQEEPNVEESLSKLLRKIDGAGDVAIILTVQTGEEYIFQTNQTTNSGENSLSSQYDTVTVTDADRNQIGLVKKTLAATYRGAVVVCEGADNPTVRLSIVEAVSNATGLPTDRISVLKMK